MRFLSSFMLSVFLCGSVHAQTTWGNTSTTATTATTGDCSPAVQKQIADYQRQSIDDTHALAAQIFTPPSEDYSTLSCLDSIMKSGPSISSVFGANSLSGILQQAVQSVCNMGTSFLQNEASKLATNVSSSIPTGDIIPGVGLGTLSGGLSINPHIGGNGSNLGTDGSYLGFPGTSIPSYNLNTLSSTPAIAKDVFPDSWQTTQPTRSGLTGSGSWW